MDLNVYATNVKNSLALPDSCIKIKELNEDERSTAEDLAAVISLDPSLSSKLLKLANSALFRFPSQISTIKKAVNVIGGEAIYNLAMMEAARSAFSKLESDAINLRYFWMHSVYSGLIAKNLAKSMKIRGSERFFLVGLLHNLGQLAVAALSPKEAKACETLGEEQMPWERQQEVLGFSYSQCTAQILKSWHLPAQVYLPIEQYQDIQYCLNEDDAALIRIASLSSHFHLTDKDRNVPDYFDLTLLRSIGAEYEDIIDCLKFAQMESNGILGLMNPSLF
jgi:HD-like signal output (HDOD) protein